MTYLNRKTTYGDQYIFVVGIGLVGSAIVRGCTRFGFTQISSVKLNWDDPKKLASGMREGFSKLLELSTEARIDFIWSAGNCGFNSSDSQTKIEMANFKIWIDEIRSILTEKQGLKFCVHLVSSAGGLFEGQYVRNRDQEPSPKRPYGFLKLDQENALIDVFRNHVQIYRLASVYGRNIHGGREGLCMTLCRNSLLGAVTTISGMDDTLRDYVFVDDVASFICRRVVKGMVEDDWLFFLVSGKPTSIFEILCQTKRILKGRVFVGYEWTPTNRKDIIFDPLLRSKGWHCCDPMVGQLLGLMTVQLK